MDVQRLNEPGHQVAYTEPTQWAPRLAHCECGMVFKADLTGGGYVSPGWRAHTTDVSIHTEDPWAPRTTMVELLHQVIHDAIPTCRRCTWTITMEMHPHHQPIFQGLCTECATDLGLVTWHAVSEVTA